MMNDVNYLKLNEEQLHKLHNELLSILVEVDKICKKHKIKYFLSDGTLLGAVRHKGFIPWDDDVDIHMLREDYDKFCKVCEQELNNSKFFLQTQEIDEEYNWSYGKVRNKNTLYVRAGQEHIKHKTGIFIDIFPIDEISGNKFIQYFFEVICKMCRKILWAPVGVVTLNGSLSGIGYKFLNILPRKVIISLFNYFAKFYNGKNMSLLVSHNLQYVKDKRYVFKKEWYEDIIMMEFEKHSFPIPIGYKEILTLTYGDYMKLPPEEDRHGRCYASYIKFSDGLELKVPR